MDERLEALVQECTVKLTVAGEYGHGTGFFVAPGLILTCHHVAKAAKESDKVISVRWRREPFTKAKVLKLLPDFDLALLEFSLPSGVNLPCVYLDREVRSQDDLYSFGYPDQDFPDGCPVTLKCEGLTGDISPFIKFKSGQVRPGMSGSALLNVSTGKVCGMVKFTRDKSFDLGGGAIPVSVILSQLPELVALNQQFHQQDRCWLYFLPQFSETITEYYLESAKFISESYGRSGAIDSRCEKNLELVRNRLKLSAKETSAIENEILQCCQNAYEQLHKNVQQFGQEVVDIFPDGSSIFLKKREELRERQEAIGLEQEPAAITLSLLGNNSLQEGNLERAIALFKEALICNSNDISAYFGLGTIWLKQGKFREALKIFKQAKDLCETEKGITQREIEQIETVIKLTGKMLQKDIIIKIVSLIVPIPITKIIKSIFAKRPPNSID